MNLWLIFLTGLTTGGLSCLAMQGGLLTSTIANQKGQEFAGDNKRLLSPASFDSLDWLPVTLFLGTKLIVHTIFGFLLGALGSVITLSLGLRVAFQFFTIIFMFATAMNLLNVHPVFRYVVFQPPRFLTRLIHNSTRSKALFAPAVLGAFTIFIPCGVTQAMEVLAINSASPVGGALTMFAFVLGTSPLFAAVGIATAKLSEVWRAYFLKIAAYALIAMSLYGLNGIFQVMDWPLSVQKIYATAQRLQQYENGQPKDQITIVNGVQPVTINVTNAGYSPRYFQVKAGIPVNLTLATKNTYSCATAFTMRAFSIFEMLQPNGSKTIAFTPTKKGRYTYTCSMGMYSGVMEVM